MTQFSLFGAAAAEPALEDLDGLLVAGGQWVRGPAGARLSVVVTDRWRADAIAAAIAALGLGGGEQPVLSAQGGWGVRTAFAPDLVTRATRWTRGANHVVPAGFVLGAGGLRLWAISAGYRDDAGYVLATAPSSSTGGEGPIHKVGGAQLSRLGVAAVSLTVRGRPGWRVTSMRRLRRLVELLGPAPDGAGGDWPVDPGSGLGAPARRSSPPAPTS